MIDLLLQIFRMGQLGSQITIIRQQKNTGCIAVKASYGIDTLWTSILHKIHHSLTLLGIVTRRHVILRFVQQDVYLLLNLDRLVVEHHRIGAQYLGSQFRHDLTIDGDNASLDEFICLTTTANTCIGKELVQTKRLVRINVDLLVLDTLLHAIFSIRIVVSRMLAWTFLIGITWLAIRLLITTLALLVSTALSLTGLVASLTLLVSTLTWLIAALLALA